MKNFESLEMVGITKSFQDVKNHSAGGLAKKQSGIGFALFEIDSVRLCLTGIGSLV